MKRIKITRTKLGRQRIWGQAHIGTGEIEIDARAKGRKELELILHECLHLLYPKQGEEGIESNAAVLARTLWAEHYRKVDNHRGDPLQDE